jgi:hypothetical protein
MKKLLTLISMVVLVALAAPAARGGAFSEKFSGKKVQLNADALKSPLKTNDAQKVKAAKMKAEAKMEGQAFTGKMFNFLQASLERVQEDKIILEERMEENFRAIKYGQVASVLGKGSISAKGNVHPRAITFSATKPSARRAANRAEVVDDNGVITSPAEGESKMYDRAGFGYYVSNQQLYYAAQSGKAEIVETSDGVVYIKDFISNVAQGTWVKGTKEGNTITIAAGQRIFYNTNYGYGLYIAKCSYVDDDNVWAEVDGDITLTVDGNTISLDGTDADNPVAAFWTDDNTFSGYGDYETVFSYDPEYVAPELVELPEGAEVETWYTVANRVSNSSIVEVTGNAQVAFVGDDVYVSGIFESFPDSWIKGTIDGSTVTFSALQYIGDYNGYNILAVGSDGSSLGDFMMTYDAAAKTLTAMNGILANAAEDKIYYLEWYNDLFISQDEPIIEEVVATTGDPIDILPYSNTLTTADEYANFGIIDSNKDNNTWNFSDSYGAYYNYTSANNADDWLISPAIKLEAGKKYRLAIDVACASPSYPERFEVLMGIEPKASALTQKVIEATDVASKEYITFENAVVTVAETGYYHFGIHAISDADMWRLQVKNFLVEAGAEPTAPAAVTDLEVAQTSGKLEAVVSFKAPTTTVGGDELTDLTKIDVLRDGQIIKSIFGSIDWVAATQGYENSQNITAIDFGGGVAAALGAGTNTSNAPRYWEADQTLRLYNGNTLTITGNAIKKVVVTFGTSSNNNLTADGFDVDGTTGTWTGSANEIAFSATAKAFIKTIEIETAGMIPGAEYSYADNAEDLTVGTHVYQVIPYNASGAGIKSEEKSIFLSIALDVPHIFDFSQNLLDLFTVIDNNADGKTWTWNASNGAYYPYHSSNAADDYLITLPFNLKAGKRYAVVVAAMNNGYIEKFEVKAGKEATVEGLNEIVIPEVVLENQSAFDDYEGIFSPAEDGLYYFAIHATSDADQYNLLINKLAISMAPELTAPAAVTDLTASAGREGALEAYLTFTAPATDIKGDALTGNVDVMIYRDGDFVSTLEGVAPGATTTWMDANLEGGRLYTYYIIASNASGEGLKSNKVSVFVGEDEYAAVDNIQITGITASTISLSWDPVTGANGGYVNAAAAKYAVVSAHVESYMYWQYLVVDEVLGTVTGETSGTFNYDTGAGDQQYKYFGVLALHQDDDLPAAGDEYVGGYTWALMGAPYELPFFESFTGSSLHYLWDTNAALIVDQESSDDDGVAVDLVAEEAGVIYFKSGKININSATSPTLLFSAKSPNISKLNVYVSMDGGNMTSIAELNLASSYQTFDISLADLKNKANYIQFAFVAQFNTPYTVNDEGTLVDLGDYITLDEIRVQEPSEYNLGEMAYNIDYSQYSGFPFYVMGYVPEWVDGVMTDYGGMYAYKTDSEMENYQMPEGAEEVGTVTTQNGTVYHKIKLTSSGWHQYFIADGIPTVIDGNYIVRAKVRASEPCTINVNMGWGWGDGQQAGASVAIGTEWQEVEWSYDGIGGTSCNLVAQPGNCTAQIEWASLAVYKKKGQEHENIVWTIAGSAEIFGSYWDPTDTNNDMTEVEDGVFVLNKKNVSLKAGSLYEFKVVGNHSWDLNYGDGGKQDGPNVEFTVDRDGIYNLQFYFYRNSGNWLSYSAEYVSGGVQPGNLEMVYNINYSDYYGFPFYVMGYVPEFDNGCMTDYGAMYTYKTEVEQGDNVVGEVFTANGQVYQKVLLDTPAWHQYFIADGINTSDYADVYTVKALVKASETVTINVNMGWGWGDGQQASASVTIPQSDDFVEVEWEYSGIDGTSCNLVAQPGATTATIEWASLAVYKRVKGEEPPAEWIEYIANGSAESSWADMGLADVRFNDMDNNYMICAWSKEKGRNMNENEGWDPFAADIELEEGTDNHVFVVHGQPATTEGDASAWDNQFWIQSPKAWKAGTQIRVKFRYKCDYDGGSVTTNTQIHKQNPGDYLIWHAIGDITFTNDWQEFDGIMSMDSDMDGGWSIAFNLNSQVKDAVNFYFDDLSWQAMKLDEGYFVAGSNMKTGLEYDFYNAIEFTWDDDMGCLSATIGTRGKKDTYVDQVMISTVRGNDQAFKGATLKPQGTIETVELYWLEYATAPNTKIYLPAAGVWKIYIDTEYQAMAFEMLEGDYKPQIEINPNPTLVAAHALERDWLSPDSNGDPREEEVGTGETWDNQFWIYANRKLYAGEETVLSFKYKATRPARTTTQCHEEPGAYRHWAAIGDVYFEEYWQEFETVFTIPQEADGMQSLAFNMAEIKEANDYYFKDVIWKLSDNTESLINQEGPENFYAKAVGGGVTQCEAESEILNVPQALEIIANLEVGEYTYDYYKVKGIVTEIKEISTTYGNATFYIQSPEVSDQTLYVYRAYGFNGEKITDENLFSVGDEVVVYSRLQNYNGIPETRQGGYLLSITHNLTPAELLAKLTLQIAASEAAIDNLTYPNVFGITDLRQLIAEAKTATEESGMDVLYDYIRQLVNQTNSVVNLDQQYQSLAELMNRVELAIQNNPNADPTLAAQVTLKIQEARTALNNGDYNPETVLRMMEMMQYYFDELSKVYLTINVESAGTLRAQIENMGFEPSNIIGLTVSGTLDYNDLNTINEMYNIEHLDMGETDVTEIWSYMFSGRPLKSVVLPKQLQNLNYYAFAWCYNLTEIELPATLQYIGYNIFYGCYNLKSITYNSIIPVELYDQLMDWDYASQCTLYVPAVVASVYQSASYWNWFQIVGTDIIPENIIVNRTIELDWPEGIGTAFKPNVTITNSQNDYNLYGSLAINGNSTISMNSFNMLWDPRRSTTYSTYDDATGSYDYYRFAYTSLVANAPMRADNVSVTLNTRTYRWDFLSFPFDVKVSDIVNLNQTNAPLVIRRYDGKNRADGKMGETWVDMTPDMTLEAGKGYIWQSAEGDEYSSDNNYSVPALDNAKKNSIFASNDVMVQLNEYLSEFSQNRSWNLIGNPYPAFYDIRGMQTTAPITVWNAYNYVYQAYVPGEDNYILNPGQAFFIQRPLDQEYIEFKKEGRQIDLNIREYVGNRAPVSQERYVFNLILSGSEEAQGDRTRIVFDATAKGDYEAGRDASKFMSPETSAAQIYTTVGNVRYAINERPVTDGIVELGLSIGTTGTYTIALSTKVENEVYLIDRETGNETRIDGGSTYTFQATKGVSEGRFAVRFGNGEVTGIKAIASDGKNADNWYNLKGQRVNTPTKGLYIQNGKKTVVK